MAQRIASPVGFLHHQAFTFFACVLLTAGSAWAQSDATTPPSTNASTPQTPDASWANDPFAEGNRFWSLRAGASRDSSLGEIYHTQLAVGKYVDDKLALYLALSLGYADANKAEDGFLGGPHVGVRWHFAEQQKLSLYLDASLGAVLHEHPITPESLHFNFDLQAGVGATWQLHDRLLLDTGIRWHHLSNARIKGKEQNLGYDGPMGYVGFVVPF